MQAFAHGAIPTPITSAGGSLQDLLSSHAATSRPFAPIRRCPIWSALFQRRRFAEKVFNDPLRTRYHRHFNNSKGIVALYKFTTDIKV